MKKILYKNLSVFVLLSIMFVNISSTTFVKASDLAENSNLYLKRSEKTENIIKREIIFPSPEIITQPQADVKAFDCSTVIDVPQSECEALVDLYESTNGAGWSSNSNWLVSTSVNSWHGISVFTGHIQEISLGFNNLVGSIPYTMGNLSNLQELNLTSNQLTGTIPDSLGNFANLSSLNLSYNQLIGAIPDSLGNLVNLSSLNLYSNQLTGSIPVDLGNLSNLNDLSLTYNQLTGTIPVGLGNLSNLMHLYLAYNQLTGTIPAVLGNLSNLLTLDLSGNQLTGTIPAVLGNLSNLLTLDLSGNQLTGTIQDTLGNLSNLGTLDLSGNQLSGIIPIDLGSLSNLWTLDLSYNQLTGPIPGNLGNISNLTHLYLYSNQLTGAIPDSLGNLSYLRYFFLSSNQLTGSIPDTLGNLSNLWTLDLSSNQLTGSIPDTLGNLSNLWNLDLSYNQLTGSIPSNLGNLSNLTRLYLYSNQLTGSIPDTLGNLSNLGELYLFSNQLTGSIPDSLGNLSNLGKLYLFGNQLTGTIPNTLGNLSSLTDLIISTNQLNGSIPDFMGNLGNLESLDLSFNQLTGSIPDSLGNLSNLTHLYLSSNQLTGSIPNILGNLGNLESLGLSTNQLNGSIPDSLGNLGYLESLDLSFNQLTGTIPDSMGNLRNLRYLDISDNQLTGSIPLSFTNLSHLTRFIFFYNDICEPNTSEFLNWKSTVSEWGSNGVICSSTTKWLLMYYIAGDYDDLDYFANLFSNVLTELNNPNAKIAIFVDSLQSPKYIGFNSNEKIEIVLEEKNTGDPQTLIDFINWAESNYSSEKIALTIFDHGHPHNGVAIDKSANGDFLDPIELKFALAETGKVDVLHFYTCSMANLEAAYQLRGLTDYIIGSENLGWIFSGSNIFQDYIPKITSDTTPRELSILIAESYYLQNLSNKTPTNISVMDMSKILSVAEKTNTLANDIQSHWLNSSMFIWAITDSVTLQRFDSNGDGMINNDDLLADLYHFAELCSFSDDFNSSAIDLMNVLSEFIIYNQQWSGIYKDSTYYLHNSHGVSIGLPRSLISYYTSDWLDFSEGANWNISPMSIEEINNETKSSYTWGSFISNMVLEFNPDDPDMPEPPPLVSNLIHHQFSIYLPTIKK